MLKKYAATFKPLKQFTVAKYFGSLTEAQRCTSTMAASLTSSTPRRPRQAHLAANSPMTTATAVAAAPAGRRAPKRVLPGLAVAGLHPVLPEHHRADPLSALIFKTFTLTWDQFWRPSAHPRVLASYRLTFGASFIAALVNLVFGLLIAWVLVRYKFPGKKIVDALVDLPFRAAYRRGRYFAHGLAGGNGWIGSILEPMGIQLAFKPAGIVIALIFIGLPFVVRTVQPVLEDAEKGAGRSRHLPGRHALADLHQGHPAFHHARAAHRLCHGVCAGGG